MSADLVAKQEEIDHREVASFVISEAEAFFRGRTIELAVDFGGGEGTHLELLRRKVEVGRCVTIDIRPPSSVGYPGIEYLQGGPVEIPRLMRPESADLVLMVEVIEHLVNPDLAVSNLRYITKAGGALVLTTPNLASLLNRIALALGYVPIHAEVSTMRVFGRPGTILAGHLRLFTYRSLRQFLEFHGWEVLRMYAVPNSGSLFRGWGRLGSLARAIDRLGSWISPTLGSRIIVVATPKTTLDADGVGSRPPLQPDSR